MVLTKLHSVWQTIYTNPSYKSCMPVGNYSPDWAIAFQEGEVKHVYFVAETKGSMSSMDLREIEKGKIACAEKLFEQMSTDNVKYGKVDSYDKLMEIVK